MKSNRIASIIIESNRIVRSVNRSGPNLYPIARVHSLCAIRTVVYTESSEQLSDKQTLIYLLFQLLFIT